MDFIYNLIDILSGLMNMFFGGLYDFKKWLRVYLTNSLVKAPRNRNGRRIVAKMGYFRHLFLYAGVLVYSEIMLRLLNGTGVFQHLIYPILFALSLGAIFNLFTTVFQKRLSRKISLIVLFLTGVMYCVECLIHSSYQTYMTIHSMMTGAEGVMTGFGKELFAAIFGGMFAIILLMAPFLLYLLLGKGLMPARRYRTTLLAPMLGIAIAFFALGSILAGTGDTASQYKDQFEFNNGTVIFGLPTSIRLSLIRSDSDAVAFQIMDNDSNTEESKSAPVAENEIPQETLPEGDVSEEVDDTVAEGDDSAPVENSNAAVDQSGENIMPLDLDAILNGNQSDAVKGITEYVKSLKASSKNKYTGLFKGKNLIMICAEAFSDSVISKELTPTLYRMQHNGFYFSDYYQPTWGGSTSSGEFSMLMGLAPTNGVDTIQETIGHNLYFTLGNQLQRLGYYNAAFHNGSYDYYSRQKTHYNLGYGTWIAKGNGLAEIAGQKYPDDEKMIATTLDTYAHQGPFSIYYMTVSGHAAYKKDKRYTKENLEYVKANVPGEYKNTTLYYLCYQVELEFAMKTLIQKLEDYGIADDTVIVLTADHYPYGLAKSTSWGNKEDFCCDLYKDKNYKDNPWGRDHNALIIWSGCLEHDLKDYACEISDPTFSLDIVPTVSNLFGLEFDSRLLVGRDVFSDAEPLVFWNNGTFISKLGSYNSKTSTFTPKEGADIPDDYLKRMKMIVSNKVNFSKQARLTDYYGVLFGEDTFTDSNYRADAPLLPGQTIPGQGGDSADSGDSGTEQEEEEDELEEDPGV